YWAMLWFDVRLVPINRTCLRSAIFGSHEPAHRSSHKVRMPHRTECLEAAAKRQRRLRRTRTRNVARVDSRDRSAREPCRTKAAGIPGALPLRRVAKRPPISLRTLASSRVHRPYPPAPRLRPVKGELIRRRGQDRRDERCPTDIRAPLRYA